MWQFLSVWFTFIADIISFARWRREHRNATNWAHYNCLAEVLFNSSNFKTFVMLFAVTHQLTWGVLSSAVGVGICCPALAVCIVTSWVIVGATPFIWYIPVAVTHLVSALVCYCWMVAATGMMVRCAMFCWNRMLPILHSAKSEGGEQRNLEHYTSMQSHAANEENSEGPAWEQVEVDLTPLKWTAVMICMMVIVFSQCYWWSGEYGYMDSVGRVLTERKTIQYLSNIFNDFTSFTRFLSTVF